MDTAEMLVRLQDRDDIIERLTRDMHGEIRAQLIERLADLTTELAEEIANTKQGDGSMSARNPVSYVFTVEGEGQFPVDMLRYDACYPRTTEDATNLPLAVHEFTRDRHQPRKVTLVSRFRQPTVARWESFGWKVTHEEVMR